MVVFFHFILWSTVYDQKKMTTFTDLLNVGILVLHKYYNSVTNNLISENE